MKFKLTSTLLTLLICTSAQAEVLLNVDLSVPDTITITATAGNSAATVSGSDGIGVYLDGFYGAAGSGLSATLVSGNLVPAANTSDSSPALFRFNGGADQGLNIWSMASDDPLNFTSGALAFAGSATWTVSTAMYNDMLAGGSSGSLYFPADDTSDLAGATLIGTWVRTPMADLAITKTDSADPVAAGTNLTYTVRVDNTGTAAADDVVVTDTLPAGVTLVSTSGCAEGAAAVPTCTLGTIATGGFAEYTITVAVDPSITGIITNNASVTTSTAESTPDNNSTSEATAVFAQADLSITKMDSSDPIISGGSQELVYTIEVSNAGPSDATNVVVTDTLSPLTLFQSTTGCQNDPNGVPACQLDTIPAGGSDSYTITVQLLRTDDTIVNFASVASDASDPASGNNSAEESTDAVAIAIPTLGKLGLMMLVLLLAGLGWVGIRRT